jgi:hypothetical protein
MREKTETARETTALAIGEAPSAILKRALMGPNSPRVYGVSLAVGSLLAVSGAFYNAGAPLLVRFIYWLPIMLIGAMMGSIVSAYVIKLERWAQSQFLSWGLLTVLVGLPMTIVVWAATSVSAGVDLDIKQIGPFASGTFMVSAVMATIFTFLHQAPPQTHAKPDDNAPPRFLDRLPLKLRGSQIYAVSAEDHYLRIHTSRGSDMILMRLSDAIAELDGIEGSQVHRSWWVARDAIEAVARGEGKAVFTLKGGTQAPVSRTFAKALREDGWY